MIKAIKDKKRHAIKVMVLTVLAGVLTGAEAVLAMGIPLPLTDTIPGPVRALVIVVVTAAAFVLRYLSQRAINRA